MPSTCLPVESLTFLKDLALHNDRAWFAVNKERYEHDLVEPARALVRRLCGDLAADFPHITGSDSLAGGSLTRIHRDTRFSKAKSPYHTHIAMHFWHRAGRKMEVPGFFLRIDESEVLLGTGLHGPEPPMLARVRKAIDRDQEAWLKATRSRAFVRCWHKLEGDSLKRPPAPWPADHPLAADLRRRDFTAFVRLPAAKATHPRFATTVVSHWRASGPLMLFLCRALGLPF